MLPDFIYIGPGRSGTTWVYKNLQKVCQIELAKNIKEVNFFNWNYDKGLSWYSSFWSSKDCVKGEISNLYIYDTAVAERIIKSLPEIKIITILRHPLDRCVSSYIFKKRTGEIAEDVSFGDAMSQGLYKESLYGELLKPYFDSNVDILIEFYDTLTANPEDLLKRICEFLSVDFDHTLFDMGKVNSSVTPRNLVITKGLKRIAFFLRKIQWFWLLDRLKTFKLLRKLLFKEVEKEELVRLSTIEREELIVEYFMDDIELLERRLSVNLTKWKR